MDTKTENIKALENYASKENTVFVRVFYKGKFVNYFFDPADVQDIGLGNIFDTIDPDPDLLRSRANWESWESLNASSDAKQRNAKRQKASIKSLP
jgi:hypothetical protein